jgi:SAM-dependent methyltransferase
MSTDTSLPAGRRRRSAPWDSAHGLLRWGRTALWATLDPFEGAERARERLADLRPRRRPGSEIEPQYPWEPALSGLLTDPRPCRDQEEFASVWSRSLRALAEQGVDVGRGTYCGWDDADRGLARATWCLVRCLRPLKVVETGVARGLTTSIVLQALEINGVGDLFSVDLPPSIDPHRFPDQTAVAVPASLKGRWTLVRGSSRRRLPGLLETLGTIDLFIHDSLHSHRNMSFELAEAWRALRPGGFLLADDVHRNSAFVEYAARVRPARALCCRSDDGHGMFGMIEKPGSPVDDHRGAPLDGEEA